MKSQTTILVAVCTIGFFCIRCSNPAENDALIRDSTLSNTNMYNGYASQVEWGTHIATISGCGDCHTPKKMTLLGPADDSTMLFAGNLTQMPAPDLNTAEMSKHIAATFDNTSWVGPWGRSYAANITPDSTGIGTWSEEQFITCIRQGLYKGITGSRPIMPPMPINSFKNMTDDELKALFAYLKTIKPIHNIVADYQPPVSK